MEVRPAVSTGALDPEARGRRGSGKGAPSESRGSRLPFLFRGPLLRRRRAGGRFFLRPVRFSLRFSVDFSRCVGVWLGARVRPVPTNVID